jgi:predicted solute-binding protein
MNFPISMIPYANMAPYAVLGPPADCYFVNCTPRNSIAALKDGILWAAAVPVGGLKALEGLVAPIGSYGIAALREVMSVLFFSDRPFDAFTAPLQVRLTDESASSVRLLYLLLGHANGFEQIPSLAQPGSSPNGEVVIGDTALLWHHEWERTGRVKGFSHMTDLAAQWYHHCQLPFVFARWVVRTDAPDRVRKHLVDWLDDFGSKENELVERSVPRVAARLNLPDDYVRRYLRIIRRCLTVEDHEGQKRFQDEWGRFGAGGSAAWFQSEKGSEMVRTHSHG